MNMQRILFISILFVQFVAYPQLRLDHISGEEGLSQNTISSILQDKNGFIWIGTYYGINKYDGYSMDHFNFSDGANGLSSNLIHSLFEDHEGYIWAGTADAGINRIHTSTGKIDRYFSEETTVGYFRNIKKIHQTKSKKLFFNAEKGLHFFKVSETGDLTIDTLVTHFNGIRHAIRDVIPASKGAHWVLTSQSDVKLWLLEENGTGNVVSPQLKSTDIKERLFNKGYVIGFIEQAKNTFWFVSNRLELLKITINDDLEVIEKERVQLVPKDSEHLRRNKQNVSIAVDKNNRLWIAGDGLLLNYDIASRKITNLNHNKNYKISDKQIEDLLIDNTNLLWFGTLDNGIYKIDLDNSTFLNAANFVSTTDQYTHKFHKYPLMAMCEDKEGTIWFGAQRTGGLASIQESQLNKSLTNPSTQSWKLNYFNNDPIFKHPIFNNIRRIFIDREQNIWIGSSNGLGKLTKKNGSKDFDLKVFDAINDSNGNPIKNAVFAIEEDASGNIWAGYWGKGLVKISSDANTGEYKYTNFILSEDDHKNNLSNSIRDIFEDSNKQIWVATVGGLNKVVERSDGSIHFECYLNKESDSTSLSNNHILDVFQAKNGKMYVGTFGGGLNEMEFSPNGKVQFKHYKIAQGLPSNVVYQMNEDNQGNIWMLHVREISKLNTSTGEITYFGRQDGFDIDEFQDNSMLKTSSGLLLCGGQNGFTFFNPEKLSVNNYKPQITISDFKLFDESVVPQEKIAGEVVLTKSINETSSIELPAHLNSLEFTFSSLHFSNPEKNLYKFILEGFEDKWQFSKGNERRFASYTNVPPGKYTFKVFGSNSVGIWTDAPKEIEITIKSPWYLTNSAFLIYSILFLFIGYVILRTRSNQLRLESKIALDKALHTKTVEMNTMKLQFFTNISHELRTPLTLILGPLQRIMNGNVDPLYLKKLNIVMHKNSIRLLKLINQFLDFRKAESGNLQLLVREGDLVHFVHEIFTSFEEIALEKDITFIFVCQEKAMMGWFDNDKIEKTLYNLLSNAFKFTARGKSIKIELSKIEVANKYFAEIKVIDYGIGISKEDLESVFERFYQTKKEDNSIHIGSGLGLAYTKRLMEIHKGTIAISSELHKGTTCIFTIPIGKDSYSTENIIESQLQHYDFKYTRNEVAGIKEDEIASIHISEPKVHPEETPTLLIVEDKKELQNYLSNLFSNTYIILTADNGEEGLKLALEQSPNIIISDLMMPKMNGIEMCKKIKSDIRTSHIPVIILTAKAGLEDEKEGLETGADAFVLKPFNNEILKLKVDNILRTKEQWIQKFNGSTTTNSIKKLHNRLDQEFLEKCIKIVKNNIQNPEFSVEIFSSEIGMSRSILYKKLKSISGLSTSEFTRMIRMKRAMKLLKSGRYSVTEVIYMVGFSDPKYFRKRFKEQFGNNPNEYLKLSR